jgi:hypothetical protein
MEESAKGGNATKATEMLVSFLKGMGYV